MADREPRDYPLRSPRSTGQEDLPKDEPRAGPLARLAGLAAIWWLLGLGALMVVALVWVFS